MAAPVFASGGSAAARVVGGAAPSPSSPSKKSSSSSSSPSSDRILRATLVLDAPVDAVWKLWTTEEGVKSFFAPGCRIEPKVDEKKTRLVFTHGSWGDGPEWDAAYAYFDKAWGGFVLPNLVWRVAHGPVDWKARPEVRPVAPTLAVDLAPKP